MLATVQHRPGDLARIASQSPSLTGLLAQKYVHHAVGANESLAVAGVYLVAAVHARLDPADNTHHHDNAAQSRQLTSC